MWFQLEPCEVDEENYSSKPKEVLEIRNKKTHSFQLDSKVEVDVEHLLHRSRNMPSSHSTSTSSFAHSYMTSSESEEWIHSKSHRWSLCCWGSPTKIFIEPWNWNSKNTHINGNRVLNLSWNLDCFHLSNSIVHALSPSYYELSWHRDLSVTI